MPHFKYVLSSGSLLIWAARFRRGCVAIGHHYDFLKTPNVVTQASGHARSDSQCLVDSGEVVVYRVDRNHGRMVLNFLGECIGQSGEAPHAHSHT